MRLHRSEARWGEDRTDEDRSRSAWSPHSYVNISYLQECYESRVLSRHRSAQIRAIAILRHKGEFPYEFVNSRGRIICTSWPYTRARPPCHTYGAAPDKRALPAGYDGERAH